MATLAAMRRFLVLALMLAAWAGPAHAGGPAMLVGAAEDAVQADNVPAAKAKLDLLRLAGFGAVRITEVWAPGQRAPNAVEQQRLAAVTGAARLDGIQVYVAVLNAGSKTTPLSAGDQNDFAAFSAAIVRRYPSVADMIVGNEPNNNRFWLPQFALDGSDAAATAYESLLAKTYDALKAVAPGVDVIGGALAPRGGDKPGTGKDTHSPTAFVNDLVGAYKATGRTLPIMDAFDMHAYEDNSSLPPSFQHPKTTTIAVADYGKLTAALAGFDGTAQPGSTLPIVYGEFGVESRIPADKASLYTGTEPATTKPVDEQTQGTYYHDALALAFCQPNVKTFFLFHAFDEPALPVVAVGRLLRGRHGEDQPAGRAQGDPGRHRRRDHPLPRPPADAAGADRLSERQGARPRAADAQGDVRHRLQRLRSAGEAAVGLDDARGQHSSQGGRDHPRQVPGAEGRSRAVPLHRCG